MTTANPGQDTQAQLQEWQRRLDTLADEIRSWSEARGWLVEVKPAEVRETLLGEYRVPHVRVVRPVPRGEVHVEPIALRIVGGDGRVDVWSFPAMNRVRLVGDSQGQWRVYTDSNVRLREPWNAELWYRLVEDLLASP